MGVVANACVNLHKQNIYIASASIPNYELENVTFPLFSG